MHSRQGTTLSIHIYPPAIKHGNGASQLMDCFPVWSSIYKGVFQLAMQLITTAWRLQCWWLRRFCVVLNHIEMIKDDYVSGDGFSGCQFGVCCSRFVLMDYDPDWLQKTYGTGWNMLKPLTSWWYETYLWNSVNCIFRHNWSFVLAGWCPTCAIDWSKVCHCLKIGYCTPFGG